MNKKLFKVPRLTEEEYELSRSETTVAVKEFLFEMPFLAPLIRTCGIRFNKNLKAPAAIAEDGTIYYNPHFFAGLKQTYGLKSAIKAFKAITYHECLHWIYHHFERAKTLGISFKEMEAANMFNIAADLSINQENTVLHFLPNELHPSNKPDFQLVWYKDYIDKNGNPFPAYSTTEHYYQLLKENPPPRPPIIKIPIEWLDQLEPFDGECEGDDDGYVIVEIEYGSGSDGIPKKWEEYRTPKPVQESIRKQIAETIKKMGNAPGELKEWATAYLNSLVDWRNVLRTKLRNNICSIKEGEQDFVWIDPYYIIDPDPIEPLAPKDQYDRTVNISVVIDTSGSMSKKEISHALAEAIQITRETNERIMLIFCDASPQIVGLVGEENLKKIEITGRGGTDMREGIKTALELDPPAELIVVLTDGYTPYPTEKPNVPVVWGILTHDATSISLPTPWTNEDAIPIVL